MSRIIDISRTLAPGIAVWPGDTEFQPFWVMRMERGDPCNVAGVTMSLHTGTHVDAPLHFLPAGATPADSDLSPFIGPVEVIDLSGVVAITRDHIESRVGDVVERVLFKTGTAGTTRFSPSFSHFTPGAAQLLVERGVRLVGIDTPSVDKSDSTTFDVHRVFGAAGVAILENLDLGRADPGRYELIALPLKLVGTDASPVRAVLRLP